MLKSHHSFLKLDRFCIEKNIRIQIKKLRRILRPGHEQCFVSVCVLYRYECSIFLYLARILKKYNTGNLYLFWWKSFGIFFGFFSRFFLFISGIWIRISQYESTVDSEVHIKYGSGSKTVGKCRSVVEGGLHFMEGKVRPLNYFPYLFFSWYYILKQIIASDKLWWG